MTALTIPARNGHESAARFKKVVSLLRALEDLNGSVLTDAQMADSIPQLPDGVRRIIEAKAGVRKSSETTWTACAQFFAERARRSGS